MSSTDWQEWALETHSPLVESLEEWLFDHGALAVSLEDNANEPLLEPGPGETPLWQNVVLKALFAGDADLSSIKAVLPRTLLAENSKSEVSRLEDREWTRVWMDDFAPIQMGPRLWVCPSWAVPPDEALVNVMLDPGLAFGTGTHATTAMCLGALDAAVSGGESVVDYGCGSGILAIAALKLGASKALGVDNDPQALAASRDNAARNQISTDQFDVVMPEDDMLLAWSNAASVVVANILAGPLLSLAHDLIELTAPGGRLLLTGVLEEQAAKLIEHYEHVSLDVIDRRDGWVLLSGVKPA
ncbi:50S ribosomal protein L11 methyltransferase [Luminiphilus sp.]|nr:50S ribosomal protein L11 methyltransferase [Luminiphilus sp.]MDA8814126.1 50S ribosomal protein L11 methyltransferase [Luminiphilus sp.]MDA9878125.1 50S ribosomal protein L11 methyltransferase [Luminiphilus sp.]MDB2433866.1 50S ribosomal protein L11 methyltransferase [Luminiphilus sp.]MDB2654274.1 50S ribosomal protein L11 methyltransferase [Luminiphilus sp.]